MSPDAVQAAVDALAERLQRSVVIDDPWVHLLYSSPHYGDEDEVRVRAVLQRGASGKAIGHVLAQGVSGWTAAGVIPAKPEIGFKARVCLPIRWQGDLLGLLIVLDPDRTVTTQELATLAAAGRELAALMAGLPGPAAEIPGVTGEAVVDLLGPDPEVRRAALRSLADPVTTVAARGPVEYVQVIDLEIRDRAGPDGPAGPAHVDVALRHTLKGQATAKRAWRTLFAVRDHGAVVVLCSNAQFGAGDVDRLVREVIHRVEEIADGRFVCVAGIGSTVTGLAAAWSSQRQARLACRAAGGIRPEPVVRWAELGILGVLLRLPADQVQPETLPDELQRLLAVDPGRSLTGTLRAYLDSGGSGPAAAEALHIHRTTLYYRLGRITELTGLDLSDGRTRLALHLSLQLLDLIEGGFRQ